MAFGLTGGIITKLYPAGSENPNSGPANLHRLHRHAFDRADGGDVGFVGAGRAHHVHVMSDSGANDFTRPGKKSHII